MDQPFGIVVMLVSIALGLFAIAFPVRMLMCCFSERSRALVRGKWGRYTLWGLFSTVYLGGAVLTGLGDRTGTSELARVHAALVVVDAAKRGVTTAWADSGRLPDSNVEAGLALPEQLRSGVIANVTVGPGGVITVRFAGAEPEPGTAQARTLVYTPVTEGGALRWDCSDGDLPAELRPSECGI